MPSIDTITSFHSILSPEPDAPAGRTTADDVLHDLALDQVLERLIARAPTAADAFRTLCADEEQIGYRQAVFRALEDPPLRAVVDAFLAALESADRCDARAAKSHYRYEPELWHLDAVIRYVEAVNALAGGLDECRPDAAGLRALARHIADHRASAAFAGLAAEAHACRDELRALRSDILISWARVTVAQTDEEPDLREEVLATFERFRGSQARPTASAPPDHGLDHVQAWVLEQVARVHPAAFGRLERFAAVTRAYRDETIARFAAEVWFYLACLDHLAPIRRAGLPICYPEVSAGSKELDARDTFDLALGTRIVSEGGHVVLNDLRLTGPERVIVVSGPNQGGKTTTARTFGQLHHLAGIGCPVPGRAVRIFLCDRVLTEFEREERLDDLEGRLGAEIERMHGLLEQATGRTVLVLNEVFSSTALQDARTLTRDVLERILALDALAVCVTFIDELSRIDERTVSMVSTVDPQDAAVRTFRVERRVADGRAHARALAAVHGLTAEQIGERMAEKGAGR